MSNRTTREEIVVGMGAMAFTVTFGALLLIGLVVAFCFIFQLFGHAEAQQEQYQKVSTRTIDLAYAYECPECKSIHLAESTQDAIACKQCRKNRVLIGVTALDDELRLRIEAERKRARESAVEQAYLETRVSQLAREAGLCQ